MTYEFVAAIWLYPGNAAWHFITVPKGISQEIKAITAGPRRGFGSVRVKVSVGDYTWKTSIFPDAKSGCYFLPIKKDARRAKNIQVGDTIELELTLLTEN